MFKFRFQAGAFDLSYVRMAASGDQITLDGGFDTPEVDGDVVTIKRRWGTIPIPAGTLVKINIGLIGNPVLPGDYSIVIETYNSFDPPIKDSGTAVFPIEQTSLGDFLVEGIPASVIIGNPFPNQITVTALDQLGNRKYDYNGSINILCPNDPLAQVPTQAIALTNGTVTLPGSDFLLRSPGNQSVIFRDASDDTKADTSIVKVNAFRINSINCDLSTVTQGQQAVPVRMLVENFGGDQLTNLQAVLSFKAGAINRNGEYVVIPAQTVASIPAEQSANLLFYVNVNAIAQTGEPITIDGQLQADYNGIPQVDNAADTPDLWTVQFPPDVLINTSTIDLGSLAQGQGGLALFVPVQNGSGDNVANADIDSSKFTFRKLSDNTDVSWAFSLIPDGGNPETLTGGQETTLKYYLTAALNAPAETIVIDQILYFRDQNSSVAQTATKIDLAYFNVTESTAITIASLETSRPTVTQNQTAPWTVTMGVSNESASPIQINFDVAKTNLSFRSGGQNVTSSYTISAPTGFSDVEPGTSIAPASTRYISFQITQTGSKLGDILIMGRIETTGGAYTNSILSDTYGGFTVQSPENVQIQNVIPSRTTATRGDTLSQWPVAVVLINRGGSTVKIDTAQSVLVFKDALDALVDGFDFIKPDALQNFGLELAANQADTLLFTITDVADVMGPVFIDATVFYQVLNTGETKNLTSDLNVFVTLQDSSEFKITDVRASKRTLSKNSSGGWHVAALLQNTGGADVEVDVISLTQTRLQFFKKGIMSGEFTYNMPQKLAASEGVVLEAGSEDSLIFPITSIATDTGSYQIVAQVQVKELNTQKYYNDLTNDARADTVYIQNPPNIVYVENSLEPKFVARGSDVAFSLDVRNEGEAALVLDPDQTGLELNEEGIIWRTQLDYSITIPGDSTRTLYFQPNRFPAGFALGNYAPNVYLSGLENGNPFEQELDLLGETVVVSSAGELTVDSLSVDNSNVTRGQQHPWIINVLVSNNGVNQLALDSALVTFTHSNTLKNVSKYFTLNIPDTLANGSAYLPGGQSDTLKISVTGVGENTPGGKVVISVKVWMIDEAASRFPSAQKDWGAFVIVQYPAVLKITRLHPSQYFVTKGQQRPWTVSVGLQNDGESDLQVSLGDSITFLEFSLGDTNFTVNYPETLTGKSTLFLTQGAQDSLLFTINNVLPGVNLGECSINAKISALELNTQTIKSDSTFFTGLGTMVMIQDSARVRIDTLIVDVPMDTMVNRNQQYYLKARLSNVGNGDVVQQATVRFQSDSSRTLFNNGILATVENIAPGESKWTEPGLLVQAGDTSNVYEVYHAGIQSAGARNEAGLIQILPALAEEDTTARIFLQRPGLLSIDTLYTSVDSVTAGSKTDWYIYAVISNTGGAALRIVKPKASDIAFLGDETYQVQAPSLSGADSLLTAGETDTLIFTVGYTGTAGGRVLVQAAVRAQDVNNPQPDPQLVQDLTQIFVRTNSTLRIWSTFVDTSGTNVDAQGICHVNTRQFFQINVEIKHEGQLPLRQAVVQLEGGKSVIQGDNQVILSNIQTADFATASFTIRADSVENFQAGETFRAKILSAVDIDGSQAIILSPYRSDSTAIAKIYRPAVLQITQTQNMAPNPDKNVSIGQSFTIKVQVTNQGSEPVTNLEVKLAANPDSLVTLDDSTKTIASLAGSTSDTLQFMIQTRNDAVPGPVGFKSQLLKAFGKNRRAYLGTTDILDPGKNDTTFALLESGARLRINRVTPSVTKINAGDYQSEWQIAVAVENNGSSDLEFSDISENNIQFRIGEKVDNDYELSAPDTLVNSGNLVLRGNTVDTLIYTVTRNGNIADKAVQIVVNLKAFDKNIGPSGELQAQNNSARIEVTSQAIVYIDVTKIVTNNHDKAGNALINRGKTFDVNVLAVAGQLVGVDNVKIVLTSNGFSIPNKTKSDTVTIEHIPAGETGQAVFSYLSNENWENNEGEITEIFTAQIIAANSENSADAAIIRPAIEGRNSASLRIQNPADLSLNVFLASQTDTVVTTSRQFQIIASIKNFGKATVDSGGIDLMLSNGYTAVGPASNRFALGDGVDSTNVTFTIQAPENATEKVAITAAFSQTQKPLDLNDNEPAQLRNNSANVYVRTAVSELEISGFNISAPAGAADGILSTDQQFTITAQIHSSSNLLNRKALIILPDLPEAQQYRLNSAAQVPFKQTEAIIQWSIYAPRERNTNPHIVTVQVTGETENGVLPPKEETLQITGVVKKAILSLDPIEISDVKEALQNNKATFNIGQPFTLQTRVTNSGDAGIGSGSSGQLELGFSTNNTGLQLVEGSWLQDFTMDEIISWKIKAPDTVTTKLHKIRVRISRYPNDENSNTTAEVGTDVREIQVSTKDRGFIQINQVRIIQPSGATDNTLSTLQQFTVRALISSRDVKTSESKAEIHFGPTGRDYIATLPVVENIQTGTSIPVDWTITAPSIPSSASPDVIWVTVTSEDSLSGQELLHTSDNLNVSVYPQAEFSLQPRILSPEDLVSTVSTGQQFSLTAQIIKNAAGNYLETDSFVVRLEIPPEFSLQGGVADRIVKNSLTPENQPVWHLFAPETKPVGLSRFVFKWITIPRDANSWQPAAVSKPEETFTLLTVNKADLELMAYLNDQSQVKESTVRIKSQFKVTVDLNNLGEAGVEGNYKVRIRLPSDDYFTSDTTKVSAGKIDWQIQAPAYVADEPDTIKFELVDPPLDVFSKQKAAVSSEVAWVTVRPEAGAVIVKPLSVMEKSVITKGKTGVKLLGLELINKQVSSGVRSLLKSVTLHFRDSKGNPVTPASVVTRIAAVRKSDGYIYRENYTADSTRSNRVFLNLKAANPDTIKGTKPSSIEFVADISSNSIADFFVSIDSASAIRVSDVIEDTLELMLTDSTGKRLDYLGFRSASAVLVESSLEKTFLNYPNPFGNALNRETKFLYYLKEPTDVQIKIFTLTGQLVRSWNYNQSQEQQTSEGIHDSDITWDGTNGQGSMVMNGVYLAYIMTGYGETAMTKIAVVK
ncbi:T9SS type A sorting domain-containing protein [candidate division KSB1 bacterium]|nr:T9SS type A sorting domain-containing protein [candidate division KSB1 bacterium]